TIALKVVESGGTATATSTTHIGAVATDSKGIVISAVPSLDVVYGPMIQWGKNPWAFADYRAYSAMTLRSAAYDTLGLGANLPFFAPLAGTVAYKWFPWSQNTTSLSGGISSTDMTFTVADVSKIDTSEFPTFINIGSSIFNFEEIKVCSVATATFTVC